MKNKKTIKNDIKRKPLKFTASDKMNLPDEVGAMELDLNAGYLTNPYLTNPKKEPLKFGKTLEQVEAFEKEAEEFMKKYGRPMPAEYGPMEYDSTIRYTPESIHNLEAKNKIKKVRRQRLWVRIAKGIQLTANITWLIFFLLFLVAFYVSMTEQMRTTGYCEGTNCYLTVK